MEKAKHTPGPWKHDYTNSAKLTYVCISAVDGSNGNTCVIGQCAGPDNEANAKLISAAPDLLRALEMIVDSDMAQREEDEGEISTELSHARAAIEKAHGREPHQTRESDAAK